MNITFLIGNGFDLACGLKTGYDHFYEWYCKQESESELIDRFKKEINEDLAKKGEGVVRNWSDLELGFARYTSRYDVNETDYFFECYDDMVSHLMLYLKDEVSKIDQKLVSEKDVELFARSLCLFYSELPPLEKELIIDVLSDRTAYNSISIVTFNYTPLIDLYVDRYKNLTPEELTRIVGKNVRKAQVEKLLHVHGTIERWPIVGVDDEELVLNKEIILNDTFRKVFLKHEAIDFLGEKWTREKNGVIDSSRIICVFGMSMGESDSKTWRRIINWLSSNNSHHLVIFRRSKIVNYISTINRKKEIDRIQESLLRFSEFDRDTNEILRTRIHIVFNTKRVFQMNLINAVNTNN